MAEECIAVRLRLINRAVTSLYDECLRPYGLRVSQANILVALSLRGRARPVEISRMLRLEKSTLSRDVEVMRRNGWVESAPPEGRGKQLLRVTKQGLELLRRIAPAWDEAQAKAQELLGGEGVGAVRRMADRLGFGQSAM